MVHAIDSGMGHGVSMVPWYDPASPIVVLGLVALVAIVAWVVLKVTSY